MFSSKEILNKYTNNVVSNKNNVNKNIKNNVVNNNYNVTNKDKQVSDIANTLATKLNSPNSYRLFCKIAYKNPQAIIDRCVGLTLESSAVRNKGGYFVSLIKQYGEI